MSVSENVTKQVYVSLITLLGKYSFLLINQFIDREIFVFKYLSNTVAVQSQMVHARISFEQYMIFFLISSIYRRPHVQQDNIPATMRTIFIDKGRPHA